MTGTFRQKIRHFPGSVEAGLQRRDIFLCVINFPAPVTHTGLQLAKEDVRATPLQVWGGEGDPAPRRLWKTLGGSWGKARDNQYGQGFTRALPASLGMLARRCVNCRFNSWAPAAFFVIKHLLKCVTALLLS